MLFGFSLNPEISYLIRSGCQSINFLLSVAKEKGGIGFKMVEIIEIY